MTFILNKPVMPVTGCDESVTTKLGSVMIECISIIELHYQVPPWFFLAKCNAPCTFYWPRQPVFHSGPLSMHPWTCVIELQSWYRLTWGWPRQGDWNILLHCVQRNSFISPLAGRGPVYAKVGDVLKSFLPEMRHLYWNAKLGRLQCLTSFVDLHFSFTLYWYSIPTEL